MVSSLRPWKTALTEMLDGRLAPLRAKVRATESRVEGTSMKGIILAGGSGTRLYPDHARRLEAAAADIRQADDLLSAQHADAGGHPRHFDHYDVRR